MNIILDVILLAIIIICFISGWRKGFIKTIMSLASLILAGLGAYFFYNIPANFLYNKFMLPKLTGFVEDTILSSAPGATVSELFIQRPKAFVDLLNRFSSEGKVEEFYNGSEAMTITDLSEYIASPLARTISNIICFVLLFIVLLLILKLVTFILDKVCKLPVLKGANTILGIIVGLLLGLFYTWILAAIISGVWPTLSAAYPTPFSPTAIEDSVLLKWLVSFNPLSFINIQ